MRAVLTSLRRLPFFAALLLLAGAFAVFFALFAAGPVVASSPKEQPPQSAFSAPAQPDVFGVCEPHFRPGYSATRGQIAKIVHNAVIAP